VIYRILKSFRGRRKVYLSKKSQKLKDAYQKNNDLGNPMFVIWIFGCQRSGTTLMERMFRNDLRSVVFGEFSQLTISPDRSVLLPLIKVKKKLSSQKARYAVVRPLFESDRARELLDSVPSSTAVWLFRDYKQVVTSMLNKWGADFFEISEKVESDNNGNWRLQHIIDEIKNKVNCTENIPDLYSLYWYKRNRIFFEEDLEPKRVLCLNYTQLVNHPSYCMETILNNAGDHLWNNFSTDVNTDSASKIVSISISKDIAKKCDELYEKLVERSTIHFPDA
jgi:hypothetical protein